MYICIQTKKYFTKFIIESCVVLSMESSVNWGSLWYLPSKEA